MGGGKKLDLLLKLGIFISVYFEELGRAGFFCSLLFKLLVFFSHLEPAAALSCETVAALCIGLMLFNRSKGRAMTVASPWVKDTMVL